MTASSPAVRRGAAPGRLAAALAALALPAAAPATAAVLAAALPGALAAQTSTGTLRGIVTGEGSVPAANAQIAARNVASGFTRNATTRDNGSYVFPGLVPGSYDVTVRRIGFAPVNRRVVVQVGATEIQNFALAQQAATLTAVNVTATTATPETRTSEVATNVTQQQIQKLPTPSRNFLDLAALSPGVSVTQDRVNGQFQTISAGGQGPNSVNLFIDGTSFKNDLTAGGIAGQDASRGNPFPRSAVQEYRVISQNFKAEYQDASSAIITATTRSGGNTWSGNALVNYQNQNFVGLDYFQLKDRAASPTTFQEPAYNRTLTAFSLGGPIVENKMHFFGSYEGNYQNRGSRTNFGALPSGFPALDTVGLARYQGYATSPFRENLFFGKVDAEPNENSSLELSVSNRLENDVRDFGANFGADKQRLTYQSAINYHQNIAVGQLKYNYFKGAALNEAKVAYSLFRRNPRPNTPGVPIRDYIYAGGEAVLGSNSSTQDYTQRRLDLRDDFTYTGFRGAGDHVFKTGVNVGFVGYNIFKDNQGTPTFFYRDSVSGNPGGATQRYYYATPYQLQYQSGDPRVNARNTQIGLYVQDDWTPVRRLTLNLGIRWDYESNMLNNGYAIPQSVADTVARYNGQFPTPLNLSEYVSNGSNRKPFTKAFQPRFGFSYALDQRNRTTVFGGVGLYYDRIQFDLYGVDPYQKIFHPSYTVYFAPQGSTAAQAAAAGQILFDPSYLTTNKAALDQLVRTAGKPEVWLIDLHAKVPKSRQANLGVRQVVGPAAVTLTYANVRGYDQMALNWANFGLKSDGTCCTSYDISAHGFSNVLYSTNDKQTWYDAIQLQVEKPYVRPDARGFGYGYGLAYSHAWRYVSGVDGLTDDFAFPNTLNIPKHPANDERDHLVANAITDVPYAFGIQASALLTLGGRVRYDVGAPARFGSVGTTGNQYQRGGFVQPGGPFPYRTLDLRFRKDFPRFGNARAAYGVTLDVFNVTNRTNFGNYNTGDRNASNFGQPTTVVTDPRRIQLGAEVNF